MQLWDLETGEVLLQLFQKAFNKDAWPAIQLSPDEDLAFHAAPNAVNVYNPRDFAAGAEAAPCSDVRIQNPSIASGKRGPVAEGKEGG